MSNFTEGKAEEWNEDRMDVIGQNGNDGLAYQDLNLYTMQDNSAAANASKQDVGSHYRYGMQVAVTQADLQRGYVLVKLDPYRICDLYQVGGGAREHIVKKALRGASKGHSERELIAELRACLDRWEEMLDEDEFISNMDGH